MDLHPRLETDRRSGYERRKREAVNYFGPERRNGLERREVVTIIEGLPFQAMVAVQPAGDEAGGTPVVHRLVPVNGHRFLSPLLVVMRLASAFAYIEADEALGRRHVLEMMKQLVPSRHGRRHPTHDERVAHLDKVKDRAVYVHFGDAPSSETDYLCAVVIPEEPLVFEYESAAHERAARPLLRRCAKILGYDIVEAPAEDVAISSLVRSVNNVALSSY